MSPAVRVFELRGLGNGCFADSVNLTQASRPCLNPQVNLFLQLQGGRAAPGICGEESGPPADVLCELCLGGPVQGGFSLVPSVHRFWKSLIFSAAMAAKV